MAHHPLINGKERGLLEALRTLVHENSQTAAINDYKLLEKYGHPLIIPVMQKLFRHGYRQKSRANA
jgi:hypothetical protein